jgi:hypothetical protein
MEGKIIRGSRGSLGATERLYSKEKIFPGDPGGEMVGQPYPPPFYLCWETAPGGEHEVVTGDMCFDSD